MNQSSVFVQFQLDTMLVSLRMTHFHHIWLVKVVDYSRYYWDFLQETIHTSPHQQRPHTYECVLTSKSVLTSDLKTFDADEYFLLCMKLALLTQYLLQRIWVHVWCPYRNLKINRYLTS